MDGAPSFLKSRIRMARGFLGVAGGATAVNAALLVVQYRLLASVVNGVVFGGRGLGASWPSLWTILAIVAIRGAAVWTAEAASIAAAARVKQSVRGEVMERLMALGPVHLAGERAGALAALLVEGVEALEPYYARFLPAMVTVALVPLAVLSAVVPADWPSGLILGVTAPLIPMAMILIGRGAERLNQGQWAKLARLGAHFLEVLQNLTTLKLFNASRREAETVARISEDYRLATMSVLRVAFLSALALEFFATLGVAFVAVFVGFRLLWGELDYQRGLFVLLAAPEFYLPLRSLGAHYHARMEAIAVAGHMAEILARPLPAAASAAPLPVGPPSAAPAIAFREVSLGYGEGRRGLDGAHFTLPPDTITALVGPSGAGKSSIVNVLLGFATPSSGTVLVDGRPLRDMDMETWRRRIAWVPQNPHLFRGSIADNIRLGDAEAGEAAIESAARLTGADAFIRALPGRYGHTVGEGGQGLSGGQRRLIALARAALRAAPLLILDEPTASLDGTSERQVAEAVRRLASGRTVLVVAHRMETVRSADAILVLERGRVVERGGHDDLMRAHGLYAALVRSGEAVAPEGAA